MHVDFFVCSYASAVREDQCVPGDVVLPSTREVNGGGGGGRVGREARTKWMRCKWHQRT